MTERLQIESLDFEGRGVARRDGKVVFVEGALPGESVDVMVTRRKSSYESGHAQAVLRPSSQRVAPRCPHFGVCGGCAMQHLEPAAQVAIKQRVLEDALWHVGKLRAAQMLPPMQGPAWAYRHRARFSVQRAGRRGGILLGFHGRKSSQVIDLRECHIVPPAMSSLLAPLRALVASLSAADGITQIEASAGGDALALLLCHSRPLSSGDIARLRAFADRHAVRWWLQPKGPDSVHPLARADADSLAYSLPEFGLRMPYRPADFTQVNLAMNRALVARAIGLMMVQPQDRVLDLFCGLGNFTLPLAVRARQVVGVEGSAALTARAGQAALRNGCADRTAFETRNLFEIDAKWLRGLGYFDRILLDPPRDGAEAVARALAALRPQERPQRIVYVSCDPATLARDAGLLVHGGGYRLDAAGVINMFPHTGHVESIAVFTPDAVFPAVNGAAGNSVEIA